MKTFDVVGYTYDGAFYCSKNCLPYPDPEDVNAVFAGDEWDYYPTCDSCGELCEDVGLTSDGEGTTEDTEDTEDTDDE